MKTTRSYWKLTPTQEKLLSKAIRGREVWDLGAGNGSLSQKCLELKARKVFAIDLTFPEEWETHSDIVWFQSEFKDLEIIPRDTVLISWPWEKTSGRERLYLIAENAQRIIVLAQNHGGTICGSPALWQFLQESGWLHHRPSQ